MEDKLGGVGCVWVVGCGMSLRGGDLIVTGGVFVVNFCFVEGLD